MKLGSNLGERMHLQLHGKSSKSHFLTIISIRDSRVPCGSVLKSPPGGMSVREYSLKFNLVARYAPNVVATMEDRVHRYVDRLDPY